MAYHGMPGPGDGYGYGYNPSYGPPVVPNQVPRTAEDYAQAMNIQAVQAQSQAGYYHPSQYSQGVPSALQDSYYQTPSIQPQYYPQYANQIPQQPQLQQYQQQPFIPQPNMPLESTYQMIHPQHSIALEEQTPTTIYVQPAQVKREPTPVANTSVQITAKKTKPKSNHVDLCTLLSVLAEEYFAAANELGPSVALNMSDNVVNKYQSLIATGLGCLEAALKDPRIPPRLEAKIRLRYSSMLLEETENISVAEMALTKGITLCAQNRYTDLRYSMQVLLTRLMFNKSQKASIKALDGYISDAELYRHSSWVYVFRFLRASFSLGSNKTFETHAALQNLRSISSIAKNRGDHSIFVTSSLMEVLAHLHMSNAETIEYIQRALANAWTYQQDNNSEVTQLLALTHLLDVTCSLLYSTPTQTLPKLKAMHVMMDNLYTDTAAWNQSDEFFAIPVSRKQGEAQVTSQDTRGVLSSDRNDRDLLMMSFLSKKDFFALTYLVTGVVLLHKNCLDNRAANTLQKGLNSISDKETPGNNNLPGLQAKLQERRTMICYFHVYLAFCAAGITDWSAFKDHLTRLYSAICALDNAPQASIIGNLFKYLSGMYHQGTGNLEEALSLYSDPDFSLSNVNPATTPEDHVRQDLAIIASLNSLWILHQDPHRNLVKDAEIIAALEIVCAEHNNKDIVAAYNLVKATVNTTMNTSNMKTKTHLKAALDASKLTNNTLFTGITLNIMCSKFFVGVVGEQAEKSARAAASQAKKSKSKLWTSVATGMLARTLDTQGKKAEAQAIMNEAELLAAVAME